MDKKFKSNHNVVYSCCYHVIWCPKYRRTLLTNSVEARLQELSHQKADELGLTIETCEIMPDHVHLFIKSSPVDSPHFIVQQLKGYTSRILRQEFPQLKTRVPTLWTRSYYIESVGHISESTVKKYIEDQKNQ
mgnify:CR=1 FL=1